MTLKPYLIRDLNNPEILRIERRNKEPKNSLGQAPEGEEAAWLYKSSEDGQIKVDETKKLQVLHERKEVRKKREKKEAETQKKEKKGSYGSINHENLMNAKTFDDLKRYIMYLLERVG